MHVCGTWWSTDGLRHTFRKYKTAVSANKPAVGKCIRYTMPMIDTKTLGQSSRHSRGDSGPSSPLWTLEATACCAAASSALSRREKCLWPYSFRKNKYCRCKGHSLDGCGSSAPRQQGGMRLPGSALPCQPRGLLPCSCQCSRGSAKRNCTGEIGYLSAPWTGHPDVQSLNLITYPVVRW